MKINKFIMAFLSIFLILLVFVGSASATDANTTNILSTVDNDEILSTGNDVSNYSELSREIGSGGHIELQHNYYIYDSGDTITISNNSFIDGKGAIIDMAKSTIIAFNIAGNNITINNLTIKNANHEYGGEIYSYGGAIYSTYSNYSITNCNFINNTANSGGAIFASYSNCNITNCYFINNTADGGGAISTYDSDCNITNCYFINNTANDGGGAISTWNNNNVCNITNCYFINNTSRSYGGGAIYFCYSYSIVDNCYFINNTSESNSIHDIYLGGFGGGAILSMSNICNITNCYFINNTADGGGAISTCHSDCNIINCYFINNTANECGGAIHTNYYDSSTIFISNSLFLNNMANATLTISRNINDIEILFTGGNNLLNALSVCDDTNITFDNVTYFGDKGITNTDIETPIKSFNKSGQNITIVVVVNDNLVLNTTKVTNDEGKIILGSIVNVAGKYEITAHHNRDSNYPEVERNLTFIQPDLVIVAKNVTKYYKGPERFVANMYDFELNPRVNKSINITINGVIYSRITDENGTVSIAINLGSGTYGVTTSVDNTTVKSSITVLSTVKGGNLTKYYKNATQYSVQVFDAAGKAVGAGEGVTFDINGVSYCRTTDENGIATLNINLPPSDYVITSDYKGCKVSNNITVLPVLSAEDITMKYLDGTQFKANLIDGQGKPYANRFVTFNIKGKIYERLTDNNGQVVLNIRLMPGEYIITSSYNGCNIANKITIS